MAYQDDLESARDNIAANLKSMTATPKPSYSIDGQSFSWAELFSLYTNQLKAIEEAIQRAGGPFELRTRGRV